MKRIIITAIAVLTAAIAVNAQNTEWCGKYIDNMEKLQELKQPKDCGIQAIDNAVATSKEIADITAKTSPLVKVLYLSDCGLTVQGINDDITSMSTLPDIATVSKDIFELADKIKVLSESMKNIEDAAKSAKPMQALKATACVKYITDVLSVTVSDSALNVELINELTQKSE